MRPFAVATVFFSFSLAAVGLDTMIESSSPSLGTRNEPKQPRDPNMSASSEAADVSDNSNSEMASMMASMMDTENSSTHLSTGAEAYAPHNSHTTQVIVIWVNHGGGKTSHSVNKAPMATGETHRVVVGGSKGLVFEPEQVTAAVGDMVIFQFMSNNHTATQSSFDNPCQPLAKGMDSGFLPNPKDSVSPAPEMAMQVVGTSPMWFYCKQGNHCQKGMTFSVNPGPSGSGKTQEDFKQKAMSANPPSGASPPMASEPSKDKPKEQPEEQPKDQPEKESQSPPMNVPSPVLTPGTGNGSIGCSCLCGVSNFPSMGSQGIGSYGGLPGALPMSAMQG